MVAFAASAAGLVSSGLRAGGTAAPALATNGRIAFGVGFIFPHPDLSAPAQVFTVKPDGSDERQLTHVSFAQGQGAGDPSFSPDGSSIAYVSNADGPFDIWLMNADGSNQHRLLTAPKTDFYSPAWSPDGSHLAVVACSTLIGTDNWCQLDTLRSDGSALKTIVGGHKNQSSPSYSPDGQRIAFSSDRAGLLSAIWLVNPDGSHLTRLTAPNLEAWSPAWSPDGTHIVLNSQCCRPNGQVFVMRDNGQDLVQLTHIPFPHGTGFTSYSPNGQQVIFISDVDRPDGSGNDLFSIHTDGTHMRALVSDQPNITLSNWGPR